MLKGPAVLGEGGSRVSHQLSTVSGEQGQLDLSLGPGVTTQEAVRKFVPPGEPILTLHCGPVPPAAARVLCATLEASGDSC